MQRSGSILRATAVVAAVVWLTAPNVQAQDSTPRSTATGVFTKEQAAKGQAAYNANCASCHGMELRSADREVPRLSDSGFKFSWVGKTVGEKFELIRDTMPLKEERSLGDQVYLDILTYILQFNKIPAGSQELKPDLEVLKQITIAAPN
jgi:mono/diheme cytochrome c family protein